MAVTVTATEFSQNVGRYQDEAQSQPVHVHKNGRPHTVLISAKVFDLLIAQRGAAARADAAEEALARLLEDGVQG
ncbi:type II toxin-antitoxin system Phd/YefM family antitoxin [Maricaulis sp. CAU 1757]